jgi:WD40 repeat protein
VNDESANLRRRLFVIATSEYEELADLPGVRDEVKAVTGWLCNPDLDERRFVLEEPELSQNPTKGQLDAAFTDGSWNAQDAVVVFVTGHGLTDGNHQHWIAVQRTEPLLPNRTAVSTAGLVARLAEGDPAHLLIILDMCYAGSTARDVHQLDVDLPPEWFVIGSAARDETATAGALTSAITAVLDELASPAGQRYGLQPYLAGREFFEAIHDQLERLAVGQSLVSLTPQMLSPAFSPCLPNPHHRPDLSRGHWASAARGSASAWLFTGRDALMQRLTAQLTGPAGTLVITGAAGSGKSAVLSRLVIAGDPRFHQDREHMVERTSAAVPGSGTVDVAVHASALHPHQILRQILDGLDPHRTLSSLGPGDFRGGDAAALPHPDALRLAWWRWLEQRPDQSPVTIIVDALDRSLRPEVVLESILKPLCAPNPAVPAGLRVRLLVSVRSPPSRGAEDPAASSPGATPAEKVAEALEADVVQVDDRERWLNRADIVDYCFRILTDGPTSPYAPPARHTAARDLADRLAERSDGSFLLARLSAESVLRRGTPVDLNDPEWRPDVAADIRKVLREDLDRTTRPDTVQLTPAAAVQLTRADAVSLLRAVAFARGSGLPWGKIWPQVAKAVSGREHTDADIVTLLASGLSGYLVAEVDNGETVYRLIHDLVRDVLRDEWTSLLGSGPAYPVDDVPEVEARIARALSRLASPVPTASGWLPPPPYLQHHLAAHAIAGDVVDDDTFPFDFLPYIDIAAARASLTTRSVNARLRCLPAMRRATHQWTDDSAANAATLELWTGALKVSHDPVAETDWEVLSVEWPIGDGEILGEHDRAVQDLATVALPDGRVIAVTGSADSTMRVWDMTTGAPIGRPIEIHTDVVEAVSVVRMPGIGPVAVSASRSELAAWDLTRSVPLARPVAEHTGEVTATVAVHLPDGRPVLVTCGDDFAQAWDLSTRRPFGRGPLVGHSSAVTSIAAMTISDEAGRCLPIAVTGSWDQTVRVWDLERSEPIGEPFERHTSRVTAVATLTLPDSRPIAVTASLPVAHPEGRRAYVHVWDVRSGDPVCEPLLARDEEVTSIATAILPGEGPVAVTGSEDGTVIVWSLLDGRQIGKPLTGQGAAVTAVKALVLADRRAIAFTGGADGKIRTWDLSLHSVESRQASTGHEGPLTVVAAIGRGGAGVVLTGGEDGVLQRQDADGPIEDRPASRGDPIRSLATVTLRGGRTKAVTGTAGPVVQYWDLHDGSGGAVRERTQDVGQLTRSVTALAALDHRDETFTVVCGGDNGVIACWLYGGTDPEVRSVRWGTEGIAAIAAIRLADRRFAVAGNAHGELQRWDLDTCKPIGNVMAGHDGRVAALSPYLLPDQTAAVVSGSTDGTIRLWDLHDGALLRTAPATHDGEVTALATMSMGAGRHVAVSGGTDGVVRAWRLPSLEPLGTPLPQLGVVRGLATSGTTESPMVVVVGDGIVWAKFRPGQSGSVRRQSG